MKQIKVGTYISRFSYIDVYLREGTGGEFYLCPEDGKIPRIKIGAYSKHEWKDVLGVAMHEVMELLLLQQGCRYSPNPDRACDTSSFIFHLDHSQFSEVCAGAGEIFAGLAPDLATAFKKFHAPVKKNKKL